MTIEELKAKNLPDHPGVYFFLGLKKKILYIGKATSLKDRTRSYFDPNLFLTRGPLIEQMILEAIDVTYTKTDSVLEALILEAYLIKKHQPHFNTREKDDKSFNYVVFTQEEFPRVLVVRGRDLYEQFSPREIKYLYGPFPHGRALREAMKIIRKLFAYRDNCTPFGYFIKKGVVVGKPCFNSQIGLCPGVCSGKVSKKDYLMTILHLKLFFEGKKSELIKKLEHGMKEYAKRREFEKAARVRNTIFAVNHIQDIALIKDESVIDKFYEDDSPAAGEIEYVPANAPSVHRIEAYDIAHMSGRNTVGVMVVVENGEINKAGYRKFRIKGEKAEVSHDIANLSEVLTRRVRHTGWPLPKIMVVDGTQAQMNAARKVLLERRLGEADIEVVAVVKDKRHRPREILGNPEVVNTYRREILLANSEAHRFAIKYHKVLRSKVMF